MSFIAIIFANSWSFIFFEVELKKPLLKRNWLYPFDLVIITKKTQKTSYYIKH